MISICDFANASHRYRSSLATPQPASHFDSSQLGRGRLTNCFIAPTPPLTTSLYEGEYLMIGMKTCLHLSSPPSPIYSTSLAGVSPSVSSHSAVADVEGAIARLPDWMLDAEPLPIGMLKSTNG